MKNNFWKISITTLKRMLASKTTSNLNSNVPSTHGSSCYVKTYWNFSIIHKRLNVVESNLKNISSWVTLKHGVPQWGYPIGVPIGVPFYCSIWTSFWNILNMSYFIYSVVKVMSQDEVSLRNLRGRGLPFCAIDT